MDQTKRSTVKALSGAALALAAAGLFVSQTVVPAAAADRGNGSLQRRQLVQGQERMFDRQERLQGPEFL